MEAEVDTFQTAICASLACSFLCDSLLLMQILQDNVRGVWVE